MKYILIIVTILCTSCNYGDKPLKEAPPIESVQQAADSTVSPPKEEVSKPDSVKDTLKDTVAAPPKKAGPTVAPTNAVKTSKDPLIGTWKWDHTVCCNRRPRTTRDSTSDKTTIVFDGKILKYYSGKTLTATKTYTITKNSEATMIRIEGKHYNATLDFNNDTLVIGYGYMDLQNEYYVKLK